METLPDVVARDRRSDAEALVASPGRRQVYTYHRFCTTAWRTGNFLRHLGVREGTRVAIADEPAAETVLALFGTALLEGTAWIGAPADVDARDVDVQSDGAQERDVQAVVAPVDAVEAYELPDGGQRAGYGGEPDEPSTYHFEEQVWSENPTRVPTEYAADDVVLFDGDQGITHRQLLDAARSAVDRYDVGESDVVAVRGSLADPGVLAAGVLAPLLAGATVILGDATAVSGEDGDDRKPTVVVDGEDVHTVAEP